MKKIAFFDFDGTITTQDTMLAIIRFHFGKVRYLLGMVFLAPFLVGLKLGWVSNQKAKERLLTYFFRGMPVSHFDELAKAFFDATHSRLIRREAYAKIQEMKAANFEVVMVTASPAAWVHHWASWLQIDYISSELEIKAGRITGRLKGINCNFAEKVNRIKEHYTLDEFGEIHCFGDSPGDREMLAIATHPYYRRFE